MKALLDRLSHWRGRDYLQKALVSRGFHIPQRYMDLVAEYGEGEACDLERYWDELAREYVCSGGRAKSRNRIFPSKQMYRSAHLDSLAEQRPCPIDGFYFIHPAIERFERRRYKDANFSIAITESLEREKQGEIDALTLDASGWDGTKRCVRDIARRLLDAHGFKGYQAGFVKRRGGLSLILHFDTGGRSDCTTVTPMSTLATDLDLTELFPFRLSNMVPGFDYYGIFLSPKSAILGLRAYAEAFDLLLNSFEA